MASAVIPLMGALLKASFLETTAQLCGAHVDMPSTFRCGSRYCLRLLTLLSVLLFPWTHLLGPRGHTVLPPMLQQTLDLGHAFKENPPLHSYDSSKGFTCQQAVCWLLVSTSLHSQDMHSSENKRS